MRITDKLSPSERKEEEEIYSKLLSEGEAFYEQHGGKKRRTESE